MSCNILIPLKRSGFEIKLFKTRTTFWKTKYVKHGVGPDVMPAIIEQSERKDTI